MLMATDWPNCSSVNTASTKNASLFMASAGAPSPRSLREQACRWRLLRQNEGTGLPEKKSNRLSPQKRPRAVSRYAVCVKNDNYDASLELRKLYQIVPDNSSNVRGLIRIIDESEESYLYPAECFLPIKLSPAIEKALRLVS